MDELETLEESELNLYTSLGHYVFQKFEKDLQKYS